MTNVSVLGSGMMGSALTYALLKGGHDVMVSDLDVAKTEPLVAAGATAAGGAVELASHAEILLPSLPTYAGLQKFLEADGVQDALKGSAIVQLSSGSPDTVAAFEKFMDGSGVDYLEGRIKAYPKDIGKPGSKIIFSGREDIFDRTRPTLAALAEHLEYLGSAIAAVAALDQAVVTASYGQIWGMMLAGRLCQAYGVSPLTLLELTKETAPVNMEDLEATGYPDLIAGRFRDDLDTATIVTWADAGAQTLDSIRAAGLDTSVFDAIQNLLKRAEESGLGDRGIHAIAEMMKP